MNYRQQGSEKKEYVDGTKVSSTVRVDEDVEIAQSLLVRQAGEENGYNDRTVRTLPACFFQRHNAMLSIFPTRAPCHS